MRWKQPEKERERNPNSILICNLYSALCFTYYIDPPPPTSFSTKSDTQESNDSTKNCLQTKSVINESTSVPLFLSLFTANPISPFEFAQTDANKSLFNL